MWERISCYCYFNLSIWVFKSSFLRKTPSMNASLEFLWLGNLITLPLDFANIIFRFHFVFDFFLSFFITNFTLGILIFEIGFSSHVYSSILTFYVTLWKSSFGSLNIGVSSVSHLGSSKTTESSLSVSELRSLIMNPPPL